MAIPDSLQHRIDLFKESGRIFQKANDVFAENSWSQVMLGQGLLPEQYHPIVNMMSDDELMRMQSHFESRQPLLRQSELGSVEQIRQWLLWIALLFALSEIFLILVRRNSTPTA